VSFREAKIWRCAVAPGESCPVAHASNDSAAICNSQCSAVAFANERFGFTYDVGEDQGSECPKLASSNPMPAGAREVQSAPRQG
jgi:hypothetical protein